MSLTSAPIRWRRTLLFAALLACAAGLGLAPITRGLLSASPTERAQFARGVMRMTDDTVADAIRVLERDEWPSRDSVITRDVAIRTLGRLRAEAGVDVLVRHLDHKGMLVTTEARRVHVGDYYPALQALVEIGPAGAKRCVREFHRFSELSRTEREKLFWVLCRIEGRQPGCFLIERELASLEAGPDSDKARAELTLALAEFEIFEEYLAYPARLYAF